MFSLSLYIYIYTRTHARTHAHTHTHTECITTVQVCPGLKNIYSKFWPMMALSRPARSAGFLRHAIRIMKYVISYASRCFAHDIFLDD